MTQPNPSAVAPSELATLVNPAGTGQESRTLSGEERGSAPKLTLGLDRNRKLLRHITVAMLALGLVFLAAMLLEHPLATNDGPVHLAFSHLISVWSQPGHPLQKQAYTLDLRINPNLAVYLLMALLMRVFTPGIAESVVQILCIAGPVAAGYYALHMVQPRNSWLAIFLLPLSLNQMLYLGLYNHCMSTAAFFLSIGTYYWMTKAPTLRRAATLSATLVLAYFCHASGFLMSLLGIGVMSGTAALLDFWRHRRVVPALRAQRHAHAAIIASLPLAALFLISGDKGVIAYGVKVLRRLHQFTELHVLAVNYPYSDRYAGVVLSGLLFASFAYVSGRILLGRSGFSGKRRDQAMGTVAASVVAFVFMLAFPDHMGGGWTHFRRFEIFPYFWLLLTVSFDTFSTAVAAWFVAIGGSAAAVLIGSMMVRQSAVRTQMAPLAQVDRLIGDHCTVLPIVVETRAEEPNTAQAWMDYEPFFQSTSRLELTGDRVVLFNYLARLTPYPVHFRPGVEPQTLIFHWKPAQAETQIEKVDVPAFEHSSGLPVDYLLLWGRLDRATPAMQQQIESAESQFGAIYKSNDGRVTLFQRVNGPASACEAKGTGLAEIR